MKNITIFSDKNKMNICHFQFFPGKLGYSMHTHFLRNALNEPTNKKKSLLIAHEGMANSLILKKSFMASTDEAIAFLQKKKKIIHIIG